ncbi:MAG: hypothetical protein WC761_00085 [Candidatus Paceibacterota bacterium]|jgi:hypothetical protein
MRNNNYSFILQAGLLASPRPWSSLYLVERASLTSTNIRERWRNVKRKPSDLVGLAAPKYEQKMCYGRETLFLVEKTEHMFDFGWIVFFEERLWYIMSSNILPHNQQP